MTNNQSFIKNLLSLGIFFLIMIGIYTDFVRAIPKVLQRPNNASVSTVTQQESILPVGRTQNIGYMSVLGSLAADIAPSILAPPALTLPLRNWSVEPPEISAESIYVFDAQNNVVLLAKNENEKRPIASLTKIMTAYVAAKHIPISATIKISAGAVSTEGVAGDLLANEELKFEDMLYALLLPSSNDAAEALAENIGRERFISLMNEETSSMGIHNTNFRNPSGLDEEEHYSTAKDIIDIFSHVAQSEPIKTIISKPVYQTRSVDGKIYHRFITSNWLLGSYPGVIGGKTGFTDEAGQALLVKWQPPESLAIERKDSLPVIYAVILGSQDRFGDMRQVLDWLQKAYHW